MSTRSKLSLITLTVLILAAVTVYLVETREPPPLEFDNSMGVSVISPPVPLPSVTLQDQNETPFPISKLEGHWSLMFFGYTHCPDVCPTTLNTLNLTSKKLPASINYVFVTLDPKRDTAEKLKGYLEYFNPSFIGLTGKKGEIDRLTKRLGVIYDYEGDVKAGDYTVNHYSGILVVDPRGRLRAHILPPHTVAKLVKATTGLMNYYGN
jgi:protein SCO1/2